MVIGFVGIVGLYGTDVLSTFSTAANTAKTFTSVQNAKKDSKSITSLKEGKENRGSMTRLTRREINAKLQQVPVFFATTKDKKDSNDYQGIYIENGQGSIFTNKIDADNYIKDKKDLKISATSLDDVYYTLIDKKTKMGKFIEGIAGKSDSTAVYSIKPSAIEVVNFYMNILLKYNSVV